MDPATQKARATSPSDGGSGPRQRPKILSLPERAHRRKKAQREADAHLAVPLCYGFTCALGAVEPLAAFALVAGVAAIASLRLFVRTRWLILGLTLLMLAQVWLPWMAVVIGIGTIVALIFRVMFVLGNLRVVVLGVLAYALIGASVVGATRSATLLSHATQWPVPDDVARLIAGVVVGLVAGVFMTLALRLANRGGYKSTHALEIMSLLPALVIGSILPFVDHDALIGAWKTGNLPSLSTGFRVPPSLAQTLGTVERLTDHLRDSNP